MMDAMDNATKVEEQLCMKATQNKIPLGGSFELSPICNMSCNMCYAKLAPSVVEAQGGLHSGSQWLELADQMQRAGTLFMLLTGGEPLLYPDFKQVYTGLKKMGMVVTVNTNGTLIDEEWAEFFAKDVPRRINITLYGTNRQTYEKLCRYPDGFERTVHGIRLLRQRGVAVKMNVSLTPENLEELPLFYEFAEQLGVPVEVDSYMFPFCRSSQCYPQSARLSTKEGAAAYWEILRRENPKGYEQLSVWYRTPKEQKWAPNHEKVICRAGKSSFWVNWQGKLSPCFAMRSLTGNLFESDFASAWHRLVEETEQIRLSDTCVSCENQHFCLSCAGRAQCETGQPSGCPEYLCEWTKEMIRLLEAVKDEDIY